MIVTRLLAPRQLLKNKSLPPGNCAIKGVVYIITTPVFLWNAKKAWLYFAGRFWRHCATGFFAGVLIIVMHTNAARRRTCGTL